MILCLVALSAPAKAEDDKCPNHPKVGFEVPKGSLVLEATVDGKGVKLTVVDSDEGGRMYLIAETTFRLKQDYKVVVEREGTWSQHIRLVQGVKMSRPMSGFDGLNLLVKAVELPNVALEGDKDGDWRFKISPKWNFSSQDSRTLAHPLLSLGDSGPIDFRTGGMGYGYREPTYPKEGWTWHLPVLMDLTVNTAATLKKALPCVNGFFWIRVEHPKPKNTPAPRGNGA